MLARLKALLETQFSGEEVQASDPEHALRLATTALMIEISRADAEVSAEEQVSICENAQRHFGLSPEETAELVQVADGRADEAVSFHDFTRVLNDRLSREERTHVVELLWKVAYADGRIDKYEDYYVRKVADLLHVSHSQFIRTKHKVIDGAKS